MKTRKMSLELVAWILTCFIFSYLNAFFIVLNNLDSKILFSVYFYGDAEIYVGYANTFLTGQTFDLGIPFHPPAAAWMLAGIFFVIKSIYSIIVMKAVLSIYAGLIAVFTALIAWRIAGLTASILAGALASMSFGLAVLSSTPGTESLYLLLILIAVFILSRPHPASWGTWLIIGLLSGLTCLTRGEHLAILPIVALSPLFIRIPDIREGKSPFYKRKFFFIACCIAGFLLPITPWMIRNALAVQRLERTIADSGLKIEPPLPGFIPVTIYGPLNFALANLPPSKGEFTREALPQQAQSSDLAMSDPLHRDFIVNGYSKGLLALKANPSRTFTLIMNKLGIFSEAFSLGFTSANFPTGLKGVRRPIDLFSPGATRFQYIIPLFALAGWLMLLRHNRPLGYLFLAIALHRLIVVSAFFGYVRQGMLLWPMAVILAVYPAKLLRNPMLRKAIALFCILICLAGLIYDGIQARTQRNFDIKYGTFPGTDMIDQQLRMELTPK